MKDHPLSFLTNNFQELLVPGPGSNSGKGRTLLYITKLIKSKQTIKSKFMGCSPFIFLDLVYHRRTDHTHNICTFGLTLTLPGPSAGVSGSLDSYCSLKPLCSGMGKVVPARTSPTLLPPSPRTVLSLSCFKVSQCINCRDWHCKS